MMSVSCRTAIVPAVLAALGAACAVSPADGSFAVEGVTPAEGPAGVAVDVEISGRGFEPALRRNASCGGETIDIDDSFDGFVGEAPLEALIMIDGSTLTGRVPGNLPAGTYGMRVVDPFGRAAFLADAYTVVGGSNGDTDTDTDTDSDTDSDTDTDTDTDTDSDTDSDTDTDTDSDSDSGTDSGTNTDSDTDTDTGADTDTYDFVCTSGQCDEDCPGGGCQMYCQTIDDCELDCQGGNCHFVCDGSGGCLLDCQAGGCTASNLSTGDLTVQCQSGNCALSCPGLGSCVVFCQGGGCSIGDCGGGAADCGGGTWVCNRACP